MTLLKKHFYEILRNSKNECYSGHPQTATKQETSKQNIITKTNLCGPRVCRNEFSIAFFGIYPYTNLERCLLSRKLPAAGMEKMSAYLKMVYTKTNLVLFKKFLEHVLRHF